MIIDAELQGLDMNPENMDIPEFWNLYSAAFPETERIPEDDLRSLASVLPLTITSWYAGGTFVAMTIVYERPEVCWFWYFAVCESLRGRGYGTMILERIKSRYKDIGLILDMESPRQEADNDEQRRRRYAFYLRNGFSDTRIERTFCGVTYVILQLGGACFTPHDYDRLLGELRSCWGSMPAESR